MCVRSVCTLFAIMHETHHARVFRRLAEHCSIYIYKTPKTHFAVSTHTYAFLPKKILRLRPDTQRHARTYNVYMRFPTAIAAKSANRKPKRTKTISHNNNNRKAVDQPYYSKEATTCKRDLPFDFGALQRNSRREYLLS